MSNIVKWGSYDAEAAQAEADDLAKSGGSKFFKFKVGKNLLRILPPPVGKKSPFRVVWQHSWNVNGEFRSVTCPRYEAKEPCPACTKADQLRGSTNPADQERAKDFFARRRIFANAIDREHPEEGPQVVAFGKTVHEALVALRTDPDAGGDYTHPESGFDIVIERKGTGKNDTEYKVLAARKSTPLGDLTWIDQQANLEQFAKVMTPDEMRERLSGQAPKKREPEYTEAKVVSRQTTQTRPTATRTVEHDTVGDASTAADDDVPF